MENTYTEDLSNFGFRELEIAGKLLLTVGKYGFPKDFSDEGVKLGFNMNSGYVFLTNNEYQVAVLEGDKLVSFYNLPSGLEGTYSDLEDEVSNMDKEDKEYFDALTA